MSISSESITSLVTGVFGQDGTYLSRELAKYGRRVVGMSRSVPNEEHAASCFAVDYHDLDGVLKLLDRLRPLEIFHLASPSFLERSHAFEREVLHLNVTVTQAFLHWIEDNSPSTRLIFGSSSEIFGQPLSALQDESSPASPQHPYAIAKYAGQLLCDHARREKGLFCGSAIFFNHESPLRAARFVSRRITRAVADIAAGRSVSLALGNLEARRDWSHAADFARGLRLMAETPAPGNFVFASGVARTVRELCREAFSVCGLDYREFLTVDEALYREEPPIPRVGQARRAGEELGWRAEIDFSAMISEMVRADLR